MDYGGNKMQELGFIIDKNGKISYFGEWIEYSKIKERKHGHTTSFEDEIEPTDYFQSLNLCYKKEDNHWLVNQAVDLSLQGVILGFNNTYYNDKTELWMFVSTDITENQRMTLTNIYSTLKNFNVIKIKTSSKNNVLKEGYEYTNVDDYFEDYGIEIPTLKL